MKLNAKVTSKINTKNNAMIKYIAIQSLVETVDALKSDLQKSGTMPFKEGELQDRNTDKDDSTKNSRKVSIVSDTPYARRLYFHPEYNFRKDKNKNAGGAWFEPYISGSKKDYARKTFAKIMKGKMK